MVVSKKKEREEGGREARMRWGGAGNTGRGER